ncbi:MAG TPA: PIN domain-containing protein [Thermoanaerobaculia bacterium]|nr:PIN domain-containing protein [Thermoanaerobaculia bacterium]
MPAAERFLLDTSALLTLTDGEVGSEVIKHLLDQAARGEVEVSISAASLMELYYIAIQEQGEDQAALLVGLVKSWPVSWLYPDEETFLLAGRMKAFHRLSFADALIAGTAVACAATLVHKDPEFETLAGELALRSLPYKGRSSEREV